MRNEGESLNGMVLLIIYVYINAQIFTILCEWTYLPLLLLLVWWCFDDELLCLSDDFSLSFSVVDDDFSLSLSLSLWWCELLPDDEWCLSLINEKQCQYVELKHWIPSQDILQQQQLEQKWALTHKQTRQTKHRTHMKTKSLYTHLSPDRQTQTQTQMSTYLLLLECEWPLLELLCSRSLSRCLSLWTKFEFEIFISIKSEQKSKCHP